MEFEAFLTGGEHAELPEDQRKFYRPLTDDEKKAYKLDEGFVPNVKKKQGFALENVDGLRNTASKRKTLLEQAEAKLAAYQLDGGEYLDPAVAKDALTKLDEIRNFNPDEKTREAIKAAEAALQEKYSKENLALKNKYEAEVTARIAERKEGLLHRWIGAAEPLGKEEQNLIYSKFDRALRPVRQEDGSVDFVFHDEFGNPVPTELPGKEGMMGGEEALAMYKKTDGAKFFKPVEGATPKGSGRTGDVSTSPRGWGYKPDQDASSQLANAFETGRT